MIKTEERAALARMVIGEERREQLIARYADRLVLKFGMRPGPARRYAEGLVDAAEPGAVLAAGQVWSKPDGVKTKGEELFRFLRDKTYTIEGFGQPGPSNQIMVKVSEGGWYAVHVFERWWLTGWPEEHGVDVKPQPPGAPLPDDTDPPDDDTDEDREVYAPRSVWFMVNRVKDGLSVGEGLPLLSAPYRACNWHKPEYDPSYGNALDVVAYLETHLADYRAGWPDYRAQWKTRESVWAAFNELDSGCECDIRVAAYLGYWLWQRVRSDVVTEYGGTVDDYDVMHMWGPSKADIILAAAPYADPEWEIPPDHPLAQCQGQTGLFNPEVTPR
jgi:hypothetical protein